MGYDNSDSITQSTGKPIAPVIFEYLTGQNKGIIVGHLCCKPNRNALSFAMLVSLNDAFDKIKADKSARVLILKSDLQKVFCAGADLKERRAMTNEQVGVFVDALRALMNKLADLAIPVIAAIDGVALGGGLELALACDIRVSTPTSLMGLVETRLGILPGAGGTQRLARVVGLAKAKEMIFTGARLSGEQAAKLGLVNYAVEDAYGKAIELAKEIVKSAPIAIRAAKTAIDKGFDVDIKKGMLIEQQAYAQVSHHLPPYTYEVFWNSWDKWLCFKRSWVNILTPALKKSRSIPRQSTTSSSKGRFMTKFVEMVVNHGSKGMSIISQQFGSVASFSPRNMGRNRR